MMMILLIKVMLKIRKKRKTRIIVISSDNVAIIQAI